MITVQPLEDTDAIGAVRCMSAAFEGAQLTPWLTDPNPVTAAILQPLDFRLGRLRGSETQLVARDDKGAVCGLISFGIQDPDAHPDGLSLGKVEASLVNWEIWLKNLPLLWKHRHAIRKYRGRIRMLHEHSTEKHKVNMRDRGHPKFVHVHLLTVSPDYQGRGIGKVLIAQAKAVAGHNQIPVYLESSAAGYQFYLHEGFEDLHNNMDLWDDGNLVWSAAAVMWQPLV